MPGGVPVDVNGVRSAAPYQVPWVAGLHYDCVAEAEGLDAGGGVGGPEADLGSVGEFVVFEVGGGLDAGAAAVGFDSVDGVGASGVGEGVAAGEVPFDVVGCVCGWLGFDLPEGCRLVGCGRGRCRCCGGCGGCGGG